MSVVDFVDPACRSRRVLVGAALVFGVLQGCGASDDPGPVPDSLGVCRDMFTKETLDRLAPSNSRVTLPSGKVTDLEDTLLPVSCGLSDSADPDTLMIAKVETIPVAEARKSIERNKRASLAEGNQCRSLGGTDTAGEGVICFGDTGATGGEQGVEVSAWMMPRYYNVRLTRGPEMSWDLARGEAIALVKEIHENLVQQLDY